MTGIQALERIAPDIPMSKGTPLRREFEYKRHGTQTLLGGFNVATGNIQGICKETRTEDDFVELIDYIIKQNPGYKVYNFVADQLQTYRRGNFAENLKNKKPKFQGTLACNHFSNYQDGAILFQNSILVPLKMEVYNLQDHSIYQINLPATCVVFHCNNRAI